MSQPIGVFDSGVGGLTVARRIKARLPCERLLYLGDTARVPYGNKSPETIERYSLNIAALLIERGAKAIVVACNTATAYALEALERSCPVPVIGVVEPVAVEAARATRAGVIGVLGTRGTVASKAYVRALERSRPGVEVIQQACPLFVPLAEEGWVRGSVAREVAMRYLALFEGTEVDTLVLGCTHYPLLVEVITEVITDIVGRDVTVLDTAHATAEVLATRLQRDGLDAAGGGPVEHTFLMTDMSESFLEGWERFFGEAPHGVEHVDL